MDFGDSRYILWLIRHAGSTRSVVWIIEWDASSNNEQIMKLKETDFGCCRKGGLKARPWFQTQLFDKTKKSGAQNTPKGDLGSQPYQSIQF